MAWHGLRQTLSRHFPTGKLTCTITNLSYLEQEIVWRAKSLSIEHGDIGRKLKKISHSFGDRPKIQLKTLPSLAWQNKVSSSAKLEIEPDHEGMIWKTQKLRYPWDLYLDPTLKLDTKAPVSLRLIFTNTQQKTRAIASETQGTKLLTVETGSDHLDSHLLLT